MTQLVDGIVTSLEVTVDAQNVPPQINLIEVLYHDERDNTNVKLALAWDAERRVFDFVGDTELCMPAARQFFDEFGARAMDWLKDYIA